MRIRTTLCTLLAITLLVAAPAPGTAQDDGALAAAQSWLALVDAEDYAASWDAAAQSVHEAVTAETFAAQLSAGRAQIGAIEARDLGDSQSMTDPPGAPPGEYVQLRFDSTASEGVRLTENVIVVQDGDRGWRVAGYFIQPAG